MQKQHAMVLLQKTDPQAPDPKSLIVPRHPKKVATKVRTKNGLKKFSHRLL